jgi:hypothetical protein
MYVAKYSSATALTESLIYDSGTNVGISTTSPAQKLSVAGKIYSSTGGFQFPDGSVQTTAAASSGFTNMSVFTSSGTFTVPAGVTKAKVTVIGGGGGAKHSTNIASYTVGGGGGGTAIEVLSGLTPGAAIAVTVGTGGAGNTAYGSTPGGTGGTSSFGSYLSATGGAGGAIPLSTQPPYSSLGGIGSGGSLNIAGSPSEPPSSYSAGGGSFMGAGGGPGADGRAYGGGGGALQASGSEIWAGSGASGVVIVEY